MVGQPGQGQGGVLGQGLHEPGAHPDRGHHHGRVRQDRRRQAARLIEARREGVAYIKAHPDEAADIVAKAYSGDPKIFREVFKHFVGFEYFGDGRLHYDNMNRMLDGMKLVGRLKGPVEWGQVVDTSFLPKDLQASQ